MRERKPSIWCDLLYAAVDFWCYTRLGRVGVGCVATAGVETVPVEVEVEVVVGGVVDVDGAEVGVAARGAFSRC